MNIYCRFPNWKTYLLAFFFKKQKFNRNIAHFILEAARGQIKSKVILWEHWHSYYNHSYYKRCHSLLFRRFDSPFTKCEENLHFLNTSELWRIILFPLPMRQRSFPLTFSTAVLKRVDPHSMLWHFFFKKTEGKAINLCINESPRHSLNSLYAVHQASLETFCPNPQKMYTST